MECRYSLLTLLLFLSLVYSCSGDIDRERVTVFEDTKTDVFDKQPDSSVAKSKPLGFGAPAFVGGMFNGKEVLAVISNAFYGKTSKSTVLEPVAKISNEDYKEWSKANVIFKRTVSKEAHNYIGKATAVMKNDKIYLLATSCDAPSTSGTLRDTNAKCDSFMIIGTLVNSPKPSGDGDGDLNILWGEEKSLKNFLKVTDNFQELLYIVGGMGNGVVMKNGTIVLPVQLKHKNKQHDSASIIYSADEGTTWHMGAQTIPGTLQGSVVEFGKDKLLLSVQFFAGVRAVYETDNMGATWRISPTFTPVWGNDPTRLLSGSQGSVITAPVGEKDVLLFSHPLNTDASRTRDTLQLWVSDGQRIACVGTISKNKESEHTGNSILAFVNNKLYVTHEITPLANKETSTGITKLDKVIAVSPLDNFFERVKTTVLAWRELDKKIVERGDISADGLVGFLGNATQDDGVWIDQYNCVNATVSGGTRVVGGYLFSGAAKSGAKWPVASQGQNQLYTFTREQFTLAATVKIYHTGETEGLLLLGAGISTEGESTNEIGIGCSQNNKWYILHGTVKNDITTLSCEPETEYHIVLAYTYGATNFYLNGLYITSVIQNSPHTVVIKEFFIGSTGTHSPAEGNLCTIKNVMLFNRHLEERKIYQLFRVSKNSNLDKPREAEKPAPLPVGQQLTQPTQSATTTVIDNSVQTEERNTGPIMTNSLQTTKKPVTVPVNDKTLSTTTLAQTSVTEKHIIYNASKNNKHLDIALDKQQSATLKNI